MTAHAAPLGSARVSRVGFGVAPKQSSFVFRPRWVLVTHKESSRSRGRARFGAGLAFARGTRALPNRSRTRPGCLNCESDDGGASAQFLRPND